VNQALAVTLTVDELEGLVRKVVRESNAEQALQSDVMTRVELAAFLKVTDKTITKYVDKDGLPGHKIGPSEWRFLRSEVLEWMKGRK